MKGFLRTIFCQFFGLHSWSIDFDQDPKMMVCIACGVRRRY